jgi:uncharacterized protein (TIGR03437 family)
MHVPTAILSIIFTAFADFTTYIGDTYAGGGPYPIADLRTAAMTTDKSGNTYLTGTRNWDTTKTSLSAQLAAFVTKIDPAGNKVFTKIFGGTGADQPTAIAVDPSGNIYVAGTTNSADLLVSNALQSTPGNSFIVKFSGDGNSVLYATYWGGYEPVLGYTTEIDAIATDTSGNLYITGTTGDMNYPVTAGMPQDAPFAVYGYAAFITKISAAGDKMIYSGTVIGGPPVCSQQVQCADIPFRTSGASIAVDAAGNAYVAANSNGVPAAIQGESHPGGAFVMKVRADGSGLAFVNNIGYTNAKSNGSTTLASIAVDGAGNTYLAGSTSDPLFPATNGAFQTTLAGGTDAFAAKLSSDGSTVLWATYLGGAGTDAANFIAADANGNAWVVGTTSSNQFPNANGWSAGNEFLAGFNSAGSTLTYSGRYPSGTVAQGIGLDATAGFVHAAGNAGVVVAITPSKPPALLIYGLTNAAGGETTGRVATYEMVSIYGPNIGPKTPVTASPDSSGEYPTVLGGVTVSALGANAQLLYVSSSQINAIVMGSQYPSTMQVVNGGVASAAFPLVQVQSSPEVFHNPDGSAIALNAHGTLNSQSNRAPLGSIVEIFVSGGAGAINLYAGSAPGAVAQQISILPNPSGFGVVPVKFRLPTVAPLGTMWVFTVVTLAQYASDPFTLWVQ